MQATQTPERRLFPCLASFASAIALCATSFAAQAADLQLSDLMQVLAHQKAGKATFVERKYIGIVDKPVESSGELAFTAPDKLEKRTLKPKAEALVLDGDALSFEQGQRKMRVRLQDYPEVAAFVESIRGTLAGDRSALERVYKLDLAGSLDKWLLQLTPLQPKMVAVVSRIRIGGTGGEVKTIEIEQADGDRSEMTVTKVQTQ